MDVDIQVTIKIGQVRLEPSRDGFLWLYWGDSLEGMEIPEAKLAACLEGFYRENF